MLKFSLIGRKLLVAAILLLLATSNSAQAQKLKYSSLSTAEQEEEGDVNLLLQNVACQGHGSRCQRTSDCCEGNECMVGDRTHKTCGGG